MVIGLVELCTLGAFNAALLSGGDSLGIGRAVSILISVPALALIIPSLILAWGNRHLKIALACQAVAAVVAIVLWYAA